VKVLVINAGSSSIKYKVFDMTDESVLAKGCVDRVGIKGTVLEHKVLGKDPVIIEEDLPDHTAGMKLILDTLVHKDYGCLQSLEEIAAVGHRVVHGGENIHESVVIDDGIKNIIRGCFDLAPLHNPSNLMGIEACQALMSNIPHIAVFDTAFHQSMAPGNFLYALPWDAYEKFKIRKYGFHGTSHRYVAHRAAELLQKPYEECKLITLHLGNGGSATAIKDGRVIDTSMGFTPLEGLVMGTRSGNIDPYVVIYLMQRLGMGFTEANNYFNKKSGLLGLSGISNDLRDIKKAALEGNERAELTIQVYVNRVKAYIGNYMAKLNGCDALVFTGGIGENAITIRRRICANMDFLGIKIDEEKNEVRGREVDLSSPDSRVKVMIIPTNEELMIARDTVRLLQAANAV